MPNNRYYENAKQFTEAKFWRNRVDELVESLNNLGLLMPKVFISQVPKDFLTRNLFKKLYSHSL